MLRVKSGFSLVEILVGILIVSIVMVAGFQALGAIGIGKVKLIEKTKMEKEAFFASEKFFEMIKKGGVIDYEEYWNRHVVNLGAAPVFVAGRYADDTGFGNYGRTGVLGVNTYGFRQYHCRSGNGSPMGTNGCLDDNNVTLDLATPDRDYSGDFQRYTQYSRQFIDRNSDADANAGTPGDEDGDGAIINDADDFYIGIGPEAFSGTTDENRVSELYFINTQGTERTYFRWNVITDPDMPSSASCDLTTNPQSPTGDGCLGTIEFLKLVGSDEGYDHDTAVIDTDGSQGDGIVDTWRIHENFTPADATPVGGQSVISHWQKIFPDTVNVSDVEFYLYPNKSLEHSWRDTDPSLQVAPYLQLKYTLQPSWKKRKGIAGAVPSVTVTNTIQLSNLDFR